MPVTLTQAVMREAPPATTIHGELTADDQHIALVLNGTEWEVERLANQLKLLTPLISPSKPPGALLIPATWPAMVQMAHTFAPWWYPGPRLRERARRETLSRAQSLAAPLRVPPPEGLTPRPYQIEGAQMIAATGRGLLFDEQGTGKTITTILGLVERAEYTEVAPIVCVVPASVIDAWVEAWQTWAPQLTTVAWRGIKLRRQKLAGTADVYVCSYDIARADAADAKGLLVKLDPKSVVVDECHLIKSPYAMRSLAARRLAKKAGAFVALSGTPITHHPGDLWPTLEGLAPLAYPSRQRWTDRYCLKVPGEYEEKIIGLTEWTRAELYDSLMGQHRRIAKADVLDQLPPKVYSVRTVELPAKWRKAYDAMEKQMIAELPDGEELSVMTVLTQLTRLNQLACAAANVETTTEIGDDGEEYTHVAVTLKEPSWKVDALLEVMDERPGQPIVAFAPSRQLVTLAGKRAEAAGYRVGYVVGGQSPRARSETVAAFQRGEYDLLCATTGAGGVGLTLTAAGTVVFLQRPWSIVEATQAEDRCHRIGSEIHSSIEIIDIVAANTIDARVRSALRQKASQLADVLQDRRIVTELLGGTKKQRGKS